MGYWYENGILTMKNLELAFFYYKLSADSGSCEALFKLGRCYEYGEMVQKDEKIAL